MLLKFVEESKKLLTSVEIFVDWIANMSPSWASYCAFMLSHLIPLDQQLVFCPVEVGENWRCLFDKCVLRVTGPEATNACQDYQLCVRLKAVIYSAVYRVQAISETKPTTKYWVFILLDEKTFSTISI